eukprot:1153936-Pelagomonas_calceolata.AAC.3
MVRMVGISCLTLSPIASASSPPPPCALPMQPSPSPLTSGALLLLSCPPVFPGAQPSPAGCAYGGLWVVLLLLPADRPLRRPTLLLAAAADEGRREAAAGCAWPGWCWAWLAAATADSGRVLKPRCCRSCAGLQWCQARS